jgi:putative Mn2+ efflux pump MntP
MHLTIIFFVAISLSMDAFSLALAYGTLNMTKRDILVLSIIVGLFHFFMPIIGNLFGAEIFKFIPVSSSIVTFLILFIIGLQMTYEVFTKKQNIKYLKIYEMFIFGFAVSIDSFSVGIGINSLYDNIIVPALIFSIFSAFFTFLGLCLGKIINQIIGKMAELIGGIVLILISLIYLF